MKLDSSSHVKSYVWFLGLTQLDRPAHHVPVAEDTWHRLATMVRDRRDQRRMSQRDLAEAAETTDRLISALERSERTTFKPATLRKIAEALSWTPDSLQRILAGGDPVEDGEPQPDLAAALAEIRERLDVIETALGMTPGGRKRRDPAEQAATLAAENRARGDRDLEDAVLAARTVAEAVVVDEEHRPA